MGIKMENPQLNKHDLKLNKSSTCFRSSTLQHMLKGLNILHHRYVLTHVNYCCIHNRYKMEINVHQLTSKNAYMQYKILLSYKEN